MTHGNFLPLVIVIYFGLNDFHLTTTPFDNQGQTYAFCLL